MSLKFSGILSLLVAVSTAANAPKCGDFFYNDCSNTADPRYDPSESNNLKDQDPIWNKLEGLWIGYYTFYNGEGVPMPASLYDETYGFGWPYDYADYRGGAFFIPWSHAVAPPST